MKYLFIVFIQLIPASLLAEDIIFKQSQKKFTYSNESQVSLLNSGGNSQFQTYDAETKNTFAWGKNLIKIEGHYTYGESKDLLNARNWHGELRYDRHLYKRLSGFLAERVEGDEFSGVKMRYNSDLGVAYLLHKNQKNTTHFEVSYRYTAEESTDASLETKKFHKARLYFETETHHSEDVSTKIWVEYIPNFSRGSDYMIKYEPSLKVALSDILSLKVAYEGAYDNLPGVIGRKKYDYIYTTSLIAKF